MCKASTNQIHGKSTEGLVGINDARDGSNLCQRGSNPCQRGAPQGAPQGSLGNLGIWDIFEDFFVFSGCLVKYLVFDKNKVNFELLQQK